MASQQHSHSLPTREEPSSPANPPGDDAIAMPDEGPSRPDLPMSMTASVILSTLPKDASKALVEAESIDADRKVTVRFSALPGAPNLGKQRAFKISASQRFETVVGFLRKRLAVTSDQALFCYVNSVFAPGLDEGVGNLWRCFKTDDQLNVSYSMTPAFG